MNKKTDISKEAKRLNSKIAIMKNYQENKDKSKGSRIKSKTGCGGCSRKSGQKK